MGAFYFVLLIIASTENSENNSGSSHDPPSSLAGCANHRATGDSLVGKGRVKCGSDVDGIAWSQSQIMTWHI